MKAILKAICCLALLAVLLPLAGADEETYMGQISDSICGPSHAKVLAARPLPDPTPDACTLRCIKEGAKYVFVSGGKVYKIANQNFPTLKVQAGHSVVLFGEMDGDTVTINRMTVPPRRVVIPANRDK